MANLLIIVLISYLVGSIPFSLIFAKIFSGVDVRQKGSGNVGATNVLVATGSKKPAFFAALFDIIKGFSVVLIVKILFGADIYAYVAGFAAVIGHDFSIYLKFKGGKGVATTSGAVIAINPLAFWILFSAYIVFFLLTKYYILPTLIALGCLPFILYFSGEGLPGAVFGFSLFILALYVHREDIKRLVEGKETKVS